MEQLRSNPGGPVESRPVEAERATGGVVGGPRDQCSAIVGERYLALSEADIRSQGIAGSGDLVRDDDAMGYIAYPQNSSQYVVQIKQWVAISVVVSGGYGVVLDVARCVVVCGRRRNDGVVRKIGRDREVVPGFGTAVRKRVCIGKASM